MGRYLYFEQPLLEPAHKALVADFEKDFDEYIAGTTGSDIRSAKALAAWNRSHADVALPPEYPNQEHIERAIAFDKDPGKRQRILEHVTEIGKRFIDAMGRYDVNVVIGSADGSFTHFAVATGQCERPPLVFPLPITSRDAIYGRIIFL